MNVSVDESSPVLVERRAAIRRSRRVHPAWAIGGTSKVDVICIARIDSQSNIVPALAVTKTIGCAEFGRPGSTAVDGLPDNAIYAGAYRSSGRFLSCCQSRHGGTHFVNRQFDVDDASFRQHSREDRGRARGIRSRGCAVHSGGSESAVISHANK